MAETNYILLASCFQYQDSLGDLVVKATADDYLRMIGNKTCSLVSLVNGQANVLVNISERVFKLEQKVVPVYTLPSLKPTGIADPNTPIRLDLFTALLESLFVEQRNATGNTTTIFDAISKQPSGFGGVAALGTQGGKMSDIVGWTADVVNLAGSLSNLWLTVLDMRGGFRNQQLNTPNICQTVAIGVQATYSVGILTLTFTGVINENLTNCEPGGSLFKIQDSTGNFINQRIDIKTLINGTSLPIDLTATPINPADDLRITGVYCLNDSSSQSVCNKYIELNVTNSAACPDVTVSSGTNSITYQFIHTAGALTYSIRLFTTNEVEVGRQNISVTEARSISGTFSELSIGTEYRLRVVMINGNTERVCPFTTITTISNPCPSPTALTAELTID